MSVLRYQVDRLERATALDPLADAIARVGTAVSPRGSRLRNLVHGSWLGHPLHPMLTDVAIGCWTSGVLLDAGRKRTETAADALIGAGCLAALPTAYTGLNDWIALGEAKAERRVGLVHALANYTATALYAASWIARRRGRRGQGVALSLVATGVASAGGYLGGHLSFRQRVGVNHAEDAAPADRWTPLLPLADVPDRRLLRARAGDADVVIYRRDHDVRVLGATCAHLGGPLDEGKVELISGEACVICPWHDSAFALDSGRVVLSPATAPVPAYDVRIDGGMITVRLHPSPVRHVETVRR